MSKQTTLEAPTAAAEAPRHYRILEFRASNFKRLQVVEINPAKHGVIITGKNSQGKTSIHDGIYATLSGSKRALPEEPIRRGTNKCVVVCKLGDKEVELTVTLTVDQKSGYSCKIVGRDGKTILSPQATLDALASKLGFDPVAFTTYKPAEQREALLKVVEIGLDLDKLAEERKALYDQRTEEGREVKRLQGAYDSMPAGKPGELVSSEAISKELKAANEAHDSYRELLGKASEVGRYVVDKTNELEQAKQQVARLKRELDSAENAVTSLEDELQHAQKTSSEAQAACTKFGALPDLDAIQERLAGVDSTNTAVRQYQARQQAEKQLQAAIASHESTDAKLKALDDRKANALAAAKMPIDGLSLTDDGLTLNGIAFSDASASEQLRASMAIAMASDPPLRVILIRDGSLLDSDSKRLVFAEAATKDFQVWMERVEDSDEGGIEIVDGMVVGSNGSEPEGEADGS